MFINQNYLKTSRSSRWAFQPFGYPQGKNFVYAYSQQINLSFDKTSGLGFALSFAYNFNGGRHINRPINANTARGDLLVKNWQAAVAAGSEATNPLFVSTCGLAPTGEPSVAAALVNFFRPSGLNPSLAQAYHDCVPLANSDFHAAGLNSSCDPSNDPSALDKCVPFGEMDANYSNGSSVYHGFMQILKSASPVTLSSSRLTRGRMQSTIRLTCNRLSRRKTAISVA